MNTPLGEFRDRKTGLVVFGIFEIILGTLCLLLVPLMLFSLAVAGRRSDGALSVQALIPGLCGYSLAGMTLIWLGVGSILARRWACALWVCVSGIGLGVGLLTIPFALWVISNLGDTMVSNGQPALAPAVLLITQIVTGVFLLLIYIVIPGVIFLFYRSPHVRHTCEVRDPKERWTDHCPLPVLALSLVTVFGAMGILSLLAFHGVFPLFGFLVDGGAGCALILALSGTMLHLGWGLYRLRTSAWVFLLAVMLIMAISGMITFWRVDLGVMYAKMGFDSRTVTMAAKMGQMGYFKWITPVSFLPWLGWLLFVRRYFTKSSVAAGTSE